MKMKMKIRSHRYNINRPRCKHGHKYSKYKKFLGMMMLICIKQHLSNIWISIHEKVKQHSGWVEFYIYIYIYIEREREREKERVYIYIEKEIDK